MGTIRDDIELELVATEREIASLRIVRDRAAYKLERTLLERERLYRHLSALDKAAREEGVA
jgi:hypothetical protein